MPIVEVDGLKKSFDTVEVLHGLSLALDKRETLVIMGGSGSGKTVLLRHIAGLIRPDAGSIRVFDRNIEHLKIGRASCRESESMSRVAESVKKARRSIEARTG